MTHGISVRTVIVMAIGLIIGSIVTSLVWSATGGSTDVRVAVRMLEDDRVEVAVQHRDADAANAAWSERIVPQYRFLRGDAERGAWRVSSPVTITHAEPQAPVSSPASQDLTRIGPYEVSGTPTGNRPITEDTILCVITHGTPADFFWFQVYSAFADAQRWHEITLRAEQYEAGVDQAAAISRCVDDGAAAIATTLADPVALKPALDQAVEAGVRVVSFNSGAEQARSVGSSAHVALDEVAVGRVAAREFAARSESEGDLLCVIHEPTNTGLEQRCDSLEAHHQGGDVHRLRLADTDGTAQDAITGAVTDSTVGVLTLNANTAYAAADALSADHPEIVLAAVSADFPRPFAMLHSGRLSFLLWSHALEQGYLTTTSLLYAHGSPFPPEAGLFSTPTRITIDPTVINAEAVQGLIDPDSPFRASLPSWVDLLERAIANEQGAMSGGGESEGESGEGEG